MKLTDLLEDVGRPVAYYPRLALALGGVKKALFLCQIAYWVGKESNRGGWIRKPQQEITDETGLSRRECESVRKSLVADGLIEERRFGEKGEMHFRVIKPALDALWDVWVLDNKSAQSHTPFNADDAPKRQTQMAESAIPVCTKAPNTNGGKRHSNRMAESATLLRTETTTETTTEREKRAHQKQEVETEPQPAAEKQPLRTPQRNFGTSNGYAAAPVAANPERAFIEGESDERFDTPHFCAVAAACDCDLDVVTWKERAKIATAAVTLARKYTPQQITLAASRWPHQTAMRPEQLTNEIQRLLNQKEQTNGHRNHTAAIVDAADLRSANRKAEIERLRNEIAGRNTASV